MIKQEKLRVIGVDCPTCVYVIKRNVLKLGGVVGFDLDASTGEAIVEYDDSKTTLRDIYLAIRDAGYDVEKKTVNIYLYIEPEEYPLLENRILRTNGVLDFGYNPVNHVAKITYNPRVTTSNTVLRELSNLGVKYSEAGELVHKKREMGVFYRRIASFTIGIVALVLGMSSMLFNVTLGYTLLVLALLVIILSHDILVRGFKSLLYLRPTMESLITLSSISTFTIGLILFVIGHHEHNTGSLFEASAGVLGFVSLGLFLEERLRYRALSHLSDLEKALHGKIRVIRNNEVVEIGVEEASIGDIVEVKAGDKILVDGVVIEGWGYVDESMFTGEPEPVFKTAENRDFVLAGSILVSGYLRIRATRVRDETVLSNILESARTAVFYKPGFQRVADRVIGFLTWIVVAIAIMTFTAWYLVTRDLVLSITIMASVLAITCPCPLGIAIPLAVSIGVIKASKNQVLIRRGDLFERMMKANALILDKTGTLTLGKPVVSDFVVYGNNTRSRVLELTCSVESRSEHPLARAIEEYCRENNIVVEDPEYYEHIPGLGVIGRVNGFEVVIGSLNLFENMEFKIPVEVVDVVRKIGEHGGTPVLVGVNGEVVGVFEIRDKLRGEALSVIEYFRQNNLRTGVLSGDIEASVEYVKKSLNLDFAYASLKPVDKARIIRELQSKGLLPIYVGDGVNDAIAINTAFIGIAMGRAPDISREAGDAVLLNNNLESLKNLYCLSRRVVKTAKINLFWAFIYNATLIPVAAGILYPYTGLILGPELAALAMILSDISVVLNSTRILVSRECR